MPFQFRKEAIEEDLNSNFPSQGQGNPPLYYSLSEVVVPTYSINNAAEGTSLPEMLQTAWDFSTGLTTTSNTTDTIINNTGFWRVRSWIYGSLDNTATIDLSITNGLTSKNLWKITTQFVSGSIRDIEVLDTVIFLKAGESVTQTTTTANSNIASAYRQIATVNGDLVNPLGFSFA